MSINPFLLRCFFMTASLISAPYVYAAPDVEKGKSLYQAGCRGCHDESVHTRPDRIILSKGALRNRVQFCDSNAGTKWNPEQMDHVIEYLNITFYKFK